MTHIIHKTRPLGATPISRSSCADWNDNDVTSPIKDCSRESNEIAGTTSNDLHIKVKAFGSSFGSFIRNPGKRSLYDVTWFAMFDKPVDSTVVTRKLHDYADRYELEAPIAQKNKSNGHSSASLDVTVVSPSNTNDNDRTNFHSSTAVTSISTDTSSGSITPLFLSRKLSTISAKERVVTLPSGEKIKHEIVDGQPTILYKDKRLSPTPNNIAILNTIYENEKTIMHHNKCIQRCFQRIEDLIICATKNACNINVNDAEALPQVETPRRNSHEENYSSGEDENTSNTL